MMAANDAAVSQLVGLVQAADDLESNRFVMGDHHLSVAVFGASAKAVADAMAKVRPDLTNGGAVVARRSHYNFKGRFRDTFKWPRSAVGYPLTSFPNENVSEIPTLK